jgi:hypothetical protein
MDLSDFSAFLKMEKLKENKRRTEEHLRGMRTFFSGASDATLRRNYEDLERWAMEITPQAEKFEEFQLLTALPGAPYSSPNVGSVVIFLRHQEHRPKKKKRVLTAPEFQRPKRFGTNGDTVVVVLRDEKLVAAAVDRVWLRPATEAEKASVPMALRKFLDAPPVTDLKTGAIVSIRPGLTNPHECPFYIVVGMNDARAITENSIAVFGQQNVRLGFIDVTNHNARTSDFFIDQAFLCASEVPSV